MLVADSEICKLFTYIHCKMCFNLAIPRPEYYVSHSQQYLVFFPSLCLVIICAHSQFPGGLTWQASDAVDDGRFIM